MILKGMLFGLKMSLSRKFVYKVFLHLEGMFETVLRYERLVLITKLQLEPIAFMSKGGFHAFGLNESLVKSIHKCGYQKQVGILLRKFFPTSEST